MKKITIVLVAMLFVNLSYGQITSTKNGGNWNESSTWLGGVVPTANDDVVIDGTVYHNNKSDACKNMTVNADKMLTALNASMQGLPLKIMGDLINNGIIKDNDGYRFQISVGKNIVNNGLWTNYGVVLMGKTDQVISGSKPIAAYFIQTQNENRIIAGSDLLISGTSLLFYKKNEFVVNADIKISIIHSDAQIRGEFMPPTNMAQGVQFTGGGTLITDGKYDLSSTKADGVTVEK